MKKNFSIVIICIFVAAGFVAVFVLYNGKINSQTANVNTAVPSAAQAPLRSGIDLYKNNELGFSIEMQNSWHARTYNNSVQDVQYGGYSVTFESSPMPLYYSNGEKPQNKNEVSLEGSSLFVGRNSYNVEKLSDYLDTTYQKGMYTSKLATIGKNLSATRIETTDYTTQFSPHYVVVSGNFIYTLGIRATNTADEAIITNMLNTFTLL